jgi:hypothetical protein
LSRITEMHRFLVALVSTLGLMTATGMLPATASGATFGANVGALFPPNQAWPSDEPAALAALHGIGATVARTDTFWATAEPSPPVNGVHTYDWTYDDRVVTALSQAGLRWQPIVDYATWWAGDDSSVQNPGVSPAHIGDYAAYAQAFAERYGQGGTFWTSHPQVRQLPVKVFEIWNEPDLPIFWEPNPDLAEYAAMYLYTRAAIHVVDPGASVIIGGLVEASTSLPAMMAAEPSLRGNVDGVAIHPYRDSLSQTLTAVAYDLSLDASTVDAPMYINEFGWNGTPGTWQGTTEANREAWTKQVTEDLGSDPGIVDVEAYCWGCGQAFDSAFELYNTPAGAAFAAGIAADEPYTQSTNTTTASATAKVYLSQLQQQQAPATKSHKKPKKKKKKKKHSKKHKHHKKRKKRKKHGRRAASNKR